MPESIAQIRQTGSKSHNLGLNAAHYIYHIFLSHWIHNKGSGKNFSSNFPQPVKTFLLIFFRQNSNPLGHAKRAQSKAPPLQFSCKRARRLYGFRDQRPEYQTRNQTSVSSPNFMSSCRKIFSYQTNNSGFNSGKF